MQTNLVGVAGAQPAGPLPQRRRDTRAPDIVHERDPAKVLTRLIRETQQRGRSLRKVGHPRECPLVKRDFRSARSANAAASAPASEAGTRALGGGSDAIASAYGSSRASAATSGSGSRRTRSTSAGSR